MDTFFHQRGFTPCTFTRIKHKSHYEYLEHKPQTENEKSISSVTRLQSFFVCDGFIRNNIPKTMEPHNIAIILHKMLFDHAFSITMKTQLQKGAQAKFWQFFQHRRTFVFDISDQLRSISTSKLETNSNCRKTHVTDDLKSTDNNNYTCDILLSLLLEQHSCLEHRHKNQSFSISFGVFAVSKQFFKENDNNIKTLFDTITPGDVNGKCSKVMKNVIWLNDYIGRIMHYYMNKLRRGIGASSISMSTTRSRNIETSIHWHEMNINFGNQNIDGQGNGNGKGKYILSMSYNFVKGSDVDCPSIQTQKIQSINMIEKVDNNKNNNNKDDEEYGDIILFSEKDYIQACFDKKSQSIYFRKNGNEKQKIGQSLPNTSYKNRDCKIELDFENFDHFLFFEIPECFCFDDNATGLTFGCVF